MRFQIQYTINREGPWVDWDSFTSFELAQQQRDRFVKINKSYVGKGFSTRILKIVETIVWEEEDAV